MGLLIFPRRFNRKFIFIFFSLPNIAFIETDFRRQGIKTFPQRTSLPGIRSVDRSMGLGKEEPKLDTASTMLESINQLTATMQHMSKELASMKLNIDKGIDGAAGSTSGSTCKNPHENHDAHADAHAHGHASTHAHAHAHGHFSIAEIAMPYLHAIVDSLNILGVFIMVMGVIAVLPTMIRHVFPGMFDRDHHHGHGHVLHVRLMMSRAIMLGLDMMVGADIIETLFGHVDIIKIMCIVAIRSFLAWERGKEAEHMTHEMEHWKKSTKALLKEISGGKAFKDMSPGQISQKTRECFEKLDLDHSGTIDHAELMKGLKMLGVKVSDSEISMMLGHGEEMSYSR